MWPIGSLRRYGVNNVCFTIVTGRYVTLDHIVPSTQAQKTSVYVKVHGCFCLNVLRPLMSLDPMVFAICSSGTAPRVRVAFSSTPSRAGSFTARYMPWPHRRLGEAQRWVVRLLQDLGRGLAMNAEGHITWWFCISVLQGKDASERGSYRSRPLREKGEWEWKSRSTLKHVANSVTCSSVKLIT